MHVRHLASLVAVSSLFVVAAACSSAAPEDYGQSNEALSDNGPPDAHVHWQKDAKPGGGGGGGNLIDHGGKVLPASNVYTIWWGPPASFPSDAKSGIGSMFQGINGTSFLGVAKQYMRGSTTMTTSYVTSLDDTSSSPPSRGPSTSAIVSEACKVINANGLAADSTALYLVYTSNFPGGRVSYCAWHSNGTCNGTNIQVAYMPNTTGIAGCDPGDLYGCNTYSQGTRSLANVSSHEYMETLTDADANAWYDSSGSEDGDKCAWQFSSCVSLKNGSWQLQKEWSNAISGCQQQ
jgi:hypothetical protein